MDFDTDPETKRSSSKVFFSANSKKCVEHGASYQKLCLNCNWANLSDPDTVASGPQGGRWSFIPNVHEEEVSTDFGSSALVLPMFDQILFDLTTTIVGVLLSHKSEQTKVYNKCVKS